MHKCECIWIWKQPANRKIGNWIAWRVMHFPRYLSNLSSMYNLYTANSRCKLSQWLRPTNAIWSTVESNGIISGRWVILLPWQDRPWSPRQLNHNKYPWRRCFWRWIQCCLLGMTQSTLHVAFPPTPLRSHILRCERHHHTRLEYTSFSTTHRHCSDAWEGRELHLHQLALSILHCKEKTVETALPTSPPQMGIKPSLAPSA